MNVKNGNCVIESIALEDISFVYRTAMPRHVKGFIAVPKDIIDTIFNVEGVEMETKKSVLDLMNVELLCGRTSLDVSKFGPFFIKAIKTIKDPDGIKKILADLCDAKKLKVSWCGWE